MKSAKVTHFSLIAIWFALALLAVASRFYDLGNKPLHFDESINGWFAMQMQAEGYYKYDPQNFHGPLYFYLIRIFESLWGRSIEILRAVPAVFSVFSVMIFSFGALRSSFVQRWMSFFILVSPAFLFFGRSGIHEMPFVFFQIIFALGVLRWMERHDSKALALLLAGLWGMAVLKETFAITILCALVASLFCYASIWKNIFSQIAAAWSKRLSFLCAVLVLLFVHLFTGFFQHLSGLLDFVKAFLPWLQTGVAGHGHDKVFWYWLQTLWSAEPLVLLGFGLALPGVFAKALNLRFMSVFSLLQLLIYSLIPYKTVWCVLSLVWGFYFVIALALAETRIKWRRFSLWGLIAVLSLLGVRSANLSVYQKPLAMDHAYIYVNSTYDLKTLSDLLLAQAKETPHLLQEPVQVGMKEQWPWPWILRSFQKIDYNLCSKAVVEKGLFYFCDLDAALFVEARLHASYVKVILPLRQEREASVIYLKKSVFTQVPFTNFEIVGEEEEQ